MGRVLRARMGAADTDSADAAHGRRQVPAAHAELDPDQHKTLHYLIGSNGSNSDAYKAQPRRSLLINRRGSMIEREDVARGRHVPTVADVAGRSAWDTLRDSIMPTMGTSAHWVSGAPVARTELEAMSTARTRRAR